MFTLGATELAVVALLLVFLFGGKKLPELARGLGQGMIEFKKGLKGASETKHSNELQS
ncbi:MAG: twin-arginine translocase TatA/TatE family subunit [Calditrichaeota bacterium]|nr:MAG: twin-arginine translocase TatA/TatE family subunit [Calditrichota bacterium]